MIQVFGQAFKLIKPRRKFPRCLSARSFHQSIYPYTHPLIPWSIDLCFLSKGHSCTNVFLTQANQTELINLHGLYECQSQAHNTTLQILQSCKEFQSFVQPMQFVFGNVELWMQYKSLKVNCFNSTIFAVWSCIEHNIGLLHMFILPMKSIWYTKYINQNFSLKCQ